MDNNYHLDLSLPDNSRSQALSAESFSLFPVAAY